MRNLGSRALDDSVVFRHTYKRQSSLGQQMGGRPHVELKGKARLNSEFGKLYLSLARRRVKHKILCDGRFCPVEFPRCGPLQSRISRQMGVRIIPAAHPACERSCLTKVPGPWMTLLFFATLTKDKARHMSKENRLLLK